MNTTLATVVAVAVMIWCGEGGHKTHMWHIPFYWPFFR